MKFNTYFFILILALLFFSCAKEVTIRDPDPNESAIVASSKLANLIQRTSLLDGSVDNILDNANCFRIELPISVVVNGQNVTVNSSDDFETIEAIFEESENNIDQLNIAFPIQIIYSNYQKEGVINMEELISLADQCNGENEEDEDIECVNFQYPIRVSVFNSNTEVTVDITIDEDEELHDLVENLQESDYASINFPVILVLADETEIKVNNLSDLEMTIDDNQDDCDEDDDYDYDDDDIDGTNFSEQDYINLLISCPWEIDELDVNDNHIEYLEDAILTFTVDGNVSAVLNNVTSTGTWSVSTDNGLRLDLIMTSLTELNQNWRLNKIEPEDDGKDKMDLRFGEDKLELIKKCN